MLVRSFRILAQPLLKSHSNVKALQSSRNSHIRYRQMSPPSPRWTYIVADGLNAYMWWWIFVHVWYQWGHLVGEYDFPDPKTWTDAELGVVDE